MVLRLYWLLLLLRAAEGWVSQSPAKRSTALLDSRSPAAREIYSRPALYDLAFSYRDYEDEVDFLIRYHETWARRKPQSVLELAAGPARHTLTALKSTSIRDGLCIDLSPEMVQYGRELAAQDLPKSGVSFDYRVGDMCDFQVDRQFDTAWILLGSMQHLTENYDVLRCLSCVREALVTGGTCIIELPHPKELFAMVDCTRNGWEIPLEDRDGNEYGELKIIWGDEDDTFDSIRQVRDFTVAMEMTGREAVSIREVVPMRMFTAQEIDAFARCCGFELQYMYGALDDRVEISDEDTAYRMVCLLEKL